VPFFVTVAVCRSIRSAALIEHRLDTDCSSSRWRSAAGSVQPLRQDTDLFFVTVALYVRIGVALHRRHASRRDRRRINRRSGASTVAMIATRVSAGFSWWEAWRPAVNKSWA